jgi:filamentous hemagglutinin family protein
VKEFRLNQWFLTSVTLLLLCNCQPIEAQVIPDTSLPSNSTVIKQDNINLIQGGTKAGNNLFHSFQDFSIPTGEIANFNNTLDIQNIISRVTGKSISNIDGLIKVSGTANLFLINPNGIIFGQNARLDIGGSFLASTANSFKFADGTEFSTLVPQTVPLLTVSVPVGLQYRNNPGNIQVLGSNLQVPNGKGITLVGGNVSIDGGQLRTPGGHVKLGSLAEEGYIKISADGKEDLSFPQGVPRSDVSLINKSEVNTVAPRGGSISVNAQNLNVLGGSQILTGISDIGFPNLHAGNIEINAIGKVTVTGSKIVNDVMSNGVGNAGDVNITASSLSVSDGSILTATFGQGSAGNVNINTRGSVSFEGLGENLPLTGVFTEVKPNAVGNGGNIKIQAESLSLNNAVQMETNSFGQGNSGNIDINTRSLSVDKNSFLGTSANGVGNAGNININISGSILFDNSSKLFASITGNGKAGEINVTARSLSVNKNSFFAASANGVGNAGNININLGDFALFDNSSKLYTNVTKKGRGGDINITAGSVFVKNASLLVASTEAEGDAGNININADSLSTNQNSFLAASANGVGNAGNININVSDFALFDTASKLYTDVTGKGKGGDINITAGSVSVKNSQLVANTQSEGDAGNININTGSLDVSNKSFITSSANGQGSAGNITINARGNVSIDKGSIFSNVGDNQFCSTVGSACRNVTIGNGGNISINALSLNLINGSFLATGVGDNLQDKRTEGNAGNISIKLKNDLFLDKSFVTSRVFSNGIGNGGQIDIQANSISSSQSAIAASTQGRGNAGGVSLQAIDKISASDSDISTAVQKGAVGNAQGINITARSLFLTDGAQLNAVTSGEGKAGSILINTTDKVSISGTNTIVTPTNFFKNDITRRYTSPPEFVDGVTSGVFTSTNTSGIGGDITVNTSAFSISDGAVMDARTTASGKGGTINVNSDTIEAKSGGQLTAIASAGGTAGSITLNATKSANFSGSDSTFQNRRAQFDDQTDIYGKLKVPNQVDNQRVPSGLFVSSSGSGFAGDLIINTDIMRLDNGATFSADTKAGGGNINLNSEALIMRRGSSITTNATGINVTGGNIILDTDVIAAFENSDITVNSEDFRGGNIKINTQSIFGTQFRDVLTPESDITATGANFELSGNVQINTPDIDPTSGLVELAVDVVDRSRLIAQGCPANQGNTFIITGRGGLPSLPNELLWSDRPVGVGWVSIEGRQSTQTLTHNSQFTEIVEATSWRTNEKGEVILTATVPVNTLNNSFLCQ